MTWLQIYNMTRRLVWGEEPPPEGTVDILQGPYGIIGNIHHNIQQWRNYWFMEQVAVINVSSGTSAYALPTGFKQVAKDGLRFINSDGQWQNPLRMLLPGDVNYFTDSTATEDYPQYYWIFGDYLNLFSVPASNQTLYMLYYKYLDRPPETFADSSDALTIEGGSALYYMAAAEMMRGIEEISKCREYEAKGQQALDILNEADMARRRSDKEQIRCVSI